MKRSTRIQYTDSHKALMLDRWLDRAPCLPLHDDGPRTDMGVVGDICEAEAQWIAGAELGIERQIEKC